MIPEAEDDDATATTLRAVPDKNTGVSFRGIQ